MIDSDEMMKWFIHSKSSKIIYGGKENERPISTHETRSRFLPFSLMLRKFLCFGIVLKDGNREFLSFVLVLRDEIKISVIQSRAWRRKFFLVSCFEMRTRILFSVSCFETRMRISVFTLVLRDKKKMHFCCGMAFLICFHFCQNIRLIPSRKIPGSRDFNKVLSRPGIKIPWNAGYC